MERVNFYAGLALDRMTERRSDSAWIESLFRNPNSRLIPVWRSRGPIPEGAPPEAGVPFPHDLSVQNDPAPLPRPLPDPAPFPPRISHLAEAAPPGGLRGLGK